MKIKIVGFKVGRDRSTCYYKVDIDEEGDPLDNQYFKLGKALQRALEKSDFVSVRK